MNYIIIAILGGGVCYLLVRLFLLKKSLREAGEQLREINRNLEENRIVTLSSPDKDFENLLVDINDSLQGIRAEKISYREREKEFKQQIENISHDLRTPLTSMLGYLRIMDAGALSQEEQEDLQTVLKKAERLQELITEFYDFSRLNAKDYGLEIESVDVAKSLREALADSYTELSRQKLEVTAQIPEAPVYILGNGGALQRVFQNLLQNAGRYALSRLEVTVSEEGEEVIICFGNDTENLGQRDADKLFERFYTGDSSRTGGSTGLGLTIAKEFVEQMGGRITAKCNQYQLYILLSFPKAL